MRRRVTVLVLCVSVCAPTPTTLVSTLKMRYVGIYLTWFLIRGFSINPSVQKLWREQANMQISSYRSRPRFELLTDGTLSKRSPVSPLCTSWMRLLASIHIPRSRSAVLKRTCARIFRGRKFLKLLKSLTVGQAVPLSVGSKLELLRAFVFAKCPYTSPYTHAFFRVCILLCIYIYTYIHVCVYIAA